LLLELVIEVRFIKNKTIPVMGVIAVNPAVYLKTSQEPAIIQQLS
jgi:hypothetical protein